MTVSPDSRSDNKYSNVTEGAPARRPEEESSLATSLKIILVVGLIALGAIGIYVATTLFSAGVQAPVDEPMPETQQREQTPAEEADQPLEETIPLDNAPGGGE